MNPRYLLSLLLISSLALLSCRSEIVQPTVEYISNAGCSATNQDLFFTITNIGSKPLILEGSTPGQDALALEINNIELTGLVSYCGRQSLAKNEVVKCRRPGKSHTDAAMRLQTGKRLFLISSPNTLRTTIGDTTRTMQFNCK